MADFPRITRNATVMGGRACLRDTHIPVSAVMALLAAGRTEADVVRMLPSLEVEDVREAMAYAAWWVDEPVQPQAIVKQTHVFPTVSAMLARPVPHFTGEKEETAEPALEPVAEMPLPAPAETVAATEEEPFRSRSHFPPPSNPKAWAPKEAPEVPAEEMENPEEAPPEEVTMEGVVTNEEAIPDESLELFHPAYPDRPTVTVTHNGLFDRRWGTHIVAWSDIEAIERRTGHKHIHIILRNPEHYVAAMPFFRRISTQVRLALNLRTFYLDTASLGIRTKDLFFTAHRLWQLNRGKAHLRKKRRIRVSKKSARDTYWQKYLPK